MANYRKLVEEDRQERKDSHRGVAEVGTTRIRK